MSKSMLLRFCLLPVAVSLAMTTQYAFSQIKDTEVAAAIDLETSTDSNEQSSSRRFKRLSDSETGINFVSRLLPDHELGFLYHSGMTCSGLATGDLDGDGRPDLVLANGPGPNAIYLQTGKGIHFEDVTESASKGADGGDNWASGVSLADVDGDGDLDLYVCNYDSANQLFINLGPGDGKRVRFEEVAELAGVAVKDASHVAAFCDYDNDGDLDFYLLTNRIEDPRGALGKLPVEFERPGLPKLLPGYQRYYDLWVVDADNWGVEATGRPDRLFRNDGVDENGQVSFTDVSSAAGVFGRGDGLSCVWWDADQDGDNDLYVCNDFISPDRFYVNNGDGTFTNQIAESMPHTTWFSMGSNFGDIDNDGDFDLLVADMAATSHYKSKVTMGVMGGMTLKRANTSSPPQYMRNALFLNEGVSDGENLFREAAYLSGLSSSDWTWSVKMNDFDCDGWLDVYLTNGVPREMNHSDKVVTREMLAGKHLWEFYKDGPMRKEQNSAFQNQGKKGDLKFVDVSREWGLDHLGASYGAVVADLDNDCDLDLVVMNLEENISVYRNDGPRGAALTVELKGKKNRFGIGAIVEVIADGKKWVQQLMPCVGYHSYDEPILHFGLGKAKRVSSVTVRWPDGTSQVESNVPINKRFVIQQTSSRDGVALAKKTQIFERTSPTGFWHVENEFNDFALQPLLPHALSAEGPCVAWADVNGDRWQDVFIGGSVGVSAVLYLGSERGLQQHSIPAFAEDLAGEDTDALFADFDSDGDMDLLVGRGGYQFAEGSAELVNVLYLGDGKGRFTKAPDSCPATATNTGALAAADFDKDGDVDVFVGARVLHAKYPLAAASELWVNESGVLKKSKEFGEQEIGLVTDALWSDIDRDGWPDLVVAREWDAIKLFGNQKGKLEPRDATAELAKRTGWWKSIDAADIDGDGDIDLLATNVGTNTKYKTSIKKPMTVYYGDFDGSGKPHIVEVKREGDVCYPERGRSCSSNAMPFIGTKFETFHDFGLASLDEIYGDEKLEAAKRFEANTFKQGVFRNEGDGKFRFEAFDQASGIAQIAPSHAGKFIDVDSDGDMDIALGQNFFGPQSETGNYDGGVGQVLRNDGDGKFSPIAPAESGFVVRDAVVAIEVVDFNKDGRPDLAVASNRGPFQIFLNKPDGKRK